MNISFVSHHDHMVTDAVLAFLMVYVPTLSLLGFSPYGKRHSCLNTELLESYTRGIPRAKTETPDEMSVLAGAAQVRNLPKTSSFQHAILGSP